jgi:HK97 family phage major capsid protein
LPVVATNAIPAGEFLVGAFQDGATLYDRMGVEVLMSTENDDDFEKNLVSIRIESRVALAVFRPDAFITGDLSASSD